MRLIKDPTPALLAQIIAAHNGRFVCDTETTGLNVRGPGAPHEARYVGLKPLGRGLCIILGPDNWRQHKPALAKLQLIGQNFRYDLHAMDLEPEQPWQDTMNVKYFANTGGAKGLDDMAKFLGLPKIETPALMKQGRIDEMSYD
ncbi:MAG: hypothetical protein IMF05_03695, partial [Proteobacteria bacterium]|nr:hypothetical protein [Pseudomonadota bacterium]